MTALESGAYLAALSRNYDFAFFEYWLTDYAGMSGYEGRHRPVGPV